MVNMAPGWLDFRGLQPASVRWCWLVDYLRRTANEGNELLNNKLTSSIQQMFCSVGRLSIIYEPFVQGFSSCYLGITVFYDFPTLSVLKLQTT